VLGFDFLDINVETDVAVNADVEADIDARVASAS